MVAAAAPLFIRNESMKSLTSSQPIMADISKIESVTSSELNVIPQEITPQRNAPIPKNYVKALEKDESAKTKKHEQIAATTPVKLIDAPYINQVNRYPTGCESVSAVMALNYFGYGISVDSFINNHLDKAVAPYVGTDGKYYGYDPREYFLGDPYSSKGWGCMAPVIVKALNRCIDSSRHKVENISGATLSSLCSYLDMNIPVIIWATQGMAAAKTSKTWTIVNSTKTYTWISPNHCLLLVGYDNSGYYFNDPLTHKNCRYSAEVAENRYNAIGRQAVIITPIAPTENISTEQCSSPPEEPAPSNPDSTIDNITENDNPSSESTQSDNTQSQSESLPKQSDDVKTVDSNISGSADSNPEVNIP